MRTPFYKGIALGAAVSMLVLVASTAVAGTGIGGIFNLGETNTVDATSRLNGTAASSMLDVGNAGTGANSNGIVGRSASPLAPALAGINSGGGSGLKGTSSSGAGLYGQSTSGLGVRAITGGSQPALKATNTGTGAGVVGEAGASGSNGVQGISGSLYASGVYGENTSTDGYGVAGRSKGANGFGVFGDNTVGGWAGYFTGKIHVGGDLDCAGCVGAAALAPGAGNRVGGYELVYASSPHDNVVRTERNIVVSCPLGKMALGGGGWALEGAADRKAALVDSDPAIYYPPGGGTPEPYGWFVKGKAMTIPYNTTLDVGVYAICANVSP